MCQRNNEFEANAVYYISPNPQRLYDVILPRRNSKLLFRLSFVCLNLIFESEKQQYHGSR